MPIDERRLLAPEIANDPNAYELVSGWAHSGGKVFVMTRTGTGLDNSPAVWGEILAAIAGNIALSVQDVTGADPTATMTTIKESLDRAWVAGASKVGKHHPR